MNSQKLTVLIIAAIGMLATFMPWVNAPIIGSIDGTKGDGWITMALFAIPAILCLLNDKTEPLIGPKRYLAVIPALIIAVIAIWKIIDFRSGMETLDQNNPFAEMVGASVSIGFGLYLLVLAAIALPIAAFVVKDKRSKESREGF